MDFDLDTIPSRAGQIAIVTGANTGLGFQSALELARKSMKVVLACRNEQRANAAADRIRAQVADADLVVMRVDLSSLASVREFAQQFRQRFNALDILVNNAGIMLATPPRRTAEGLDQILAANYLGHFVLTKELIGLMPDTEASRVVSLSSITHKSGQIHFDDIHLENKYSDSKAYAQSKLACLMFGDELQRRLEQSGKKILSVTAHPGASLTDLNRNMSASGQFFVKWLVGPLLTDSVESGTLPTLLAALSPELKGGEYIGPTKRFEFIGPPGFAKRAKAAQDAEAGKRLFELSEQLTGAQFDFA